jgi:hypothetical protein
MVMGREFVAVRLRDAQARGDLDPDIDAPRAAELPVRLGFSFLLMPGTSLSVGDADAAADVARTLIALILGSA